MVKPEARTLYNIFNPTEMLSYLVPFNEGCRAAIHCTSEHCCLTHRHPTILRRHTELGRYWGNRELGATRK